MRLFATLSLTAILAVVLSAPAEDTEPSKKLNTPPKGFTALFNGKDLDGWQMNVDMRERKKFSQEEYEKAVKDRAPLMKHWVVKDGVIHHDGKGRSLQTVKDYGNFELYVDWKIEEKGDSGLYLRGQPQVQIWDSDKSGGARNEDKGTGSGGLWNNPFPPEVAKSKDNDLRLKEGRKIGKIPLKKADKPVGEWNTFHIIMKGDKVTVNLNGVKVVDQATLPNYWERGQPLPKKGPIELQHHGDKLWFRNIYIKELPD